MNDSKNPCCASFVWGDPPNRSSTMRDSKLPARLATVGDHWSASKAPASGEFRAKGEARNSPEAGALLADQWSPTVANLAGSFESRMVLDLLGGSPQTKDAQHGFFESFIQG